MGTKREHELELKQVLKEEKDFDLLCNHFTVTLEMAKAQVNHYLDTDDYQLYKQEVTLRIRLKHGGGSELTLKVDHPTKAGKLELTHCPLFDEEYNAIMVDRVLPPGPVRNKLSKYTASPVKYQGILKTERITIPMPFGKIMLDKNTYLGKVDYEIELEIDILSNNKKKNTEDAKLYFDSLLKTFKIEQTKSISKSGRYFRRKISIEK